jgi:hypothetical protein
MRVVRSTATELEILDTGLGARVMGAFCVFVGAGALWLDLSERRPGEWPALLTLFVGAVFVRVGLYAILLIGSTRHRFDSAAGKVVVRTRSLQETSETVIPLADIADVVLETETTDWPDGPQVTNYRLAYVLATGEHVPWVPYLNGTRSDKIVCLYAARAFLRCAAARASEGLVFAKRAQAPAGVRAGSERSSG